MDKNRTCFFTGHRDIPEYVQHLINAKLLETIDGLYGKGYVNFICGGAVGFDTMAAKAVLERKKELDIRLVLYLPCKDQDKKFSPKQKAEYQAILESADEVLVMYEHYVRGCMHARNRKMADDSSKCVAFCTEKTGGTAYTVNYADKKGIEIIMI